MCRLSPVTDCITLDTAAAVYAAAALFIPQGGHDGSPRYPTHLAVGRRLTVRRMESQTRISHAHFRIEQRSHRFRGDLSHSVDIAGAKKIW